MPPKLYRVVLPVDNIDRAEAFYSTILRLPGRRVSPGRHYFDCGGVILACYDPRADGDRRDARPLPDPVYLAVPDLEAVYITVKAADGATIRGPIERRPWGERSFYIEDPFGNPVCFVDEATVFTGEG